MKKLLLLALTALLLAAAFAGYAVAENREITVLVYMCGSNLESVYGSATKDIQEMIDSGFDSKRVTVLVLAGGSEQWKKGYDARQLSIIEVTS